MISITDLLIVFIFIGILILIFFLKKSLEKFNDTIKMGIIKEKAIKVLPTEETVFKFLNYLIAKEWEHEYSYNILPEMNSYDHGKISSNVTKTIQPAQLDESTLFITEKILKVLSEDYRNYLSIYISEDLIDDFVAEEVYIFGIKFSSAISKKTK